MVKLFEPIKPFLYAFLFVLFFCLYFVNGGFSGVFCPGINGAVLADCSRDCQTSHNAVNGRCGINYNCYCSFPRDTVNPNSTQCLDATKPKWGEICMHDCQCQHGALGGVCDYERHGCNCIGSIFGYRRNYCPFASRREILSWFNESYVSLGYAQFADELISGKFGRDPHLVTTD